MKPPAGKAPLRRMAVKKKQVARLDLKPRPKPKPEPDTETQIKGSFWRWVILVALLHVLVITLGFFIYTATPAPKPPEQFISLLPQGDIVKGTAGAQEAPKIGPTTAAPSVKKSSPPPDPTTPPKQLAVKPKPPTPTPKPKLPDPPPLAKLDKPDALADKPITPPKPAPPKPPKVKVDLTLADGPQTPVDKPVKPHKKKHTEAKPTDDPDATDKDAATNPDSAGLSKEQIAAKLGKKLDAPGVKNALKSGTSGSANSRANDFSDFYASIRDQVMSQWSSPNLTDETAVNPIVEIHVEKDGRVPSESVHLIQSSGNSTYDDTALEAAKSLGYLHQPLPDGCPPDIPITFKLTR